MAKIIGKWWWAIILLLLAGLYSYGVQKMFFHQDDLDWFILANKPFWQMMASPIGDHVNYVFRLLLKFEWEIFHLYFPGYLAVSTIMHGLVVWLIYKLAKMISGRKDLSALAAIIFAINTNWTEVVLWTSGQTISISAIFVLIAMIAIHKKKGEILTLFLASWTSALALGLPVSALIVYGYLPIKKRISTVGWGAIGSLGLVAILMAWKRTDGTAIELSLAWGMKVVLVWGLAMINSVVGRLFLPFDRFEMVRIGCVSLLVIYGVWRYRDRLLGIWKDNFSRLIIIQLSVYYLIVAIGRAQYGVGIMRAERYAYLGLALFLLLSARIMKNVKFGRWVWVVPLIVLVQCASLYRRAEDYVVRPQQMKRLFTEVQRTGSQEIDQNAYLPHFVLNDERLKYSDLMILIND
jgi:hypothetical protein